MERTDRGKDTSLLKNQPYDESLEVVDSEEVASVYSPTPSGQRQVRSSGQPAWLMALSPPNSSTQAELRVLPSLRIYLWTIFNMISSASSCIYFEWLNL